MSTISMNKRKPVTVQMIGSFVDAAAGTSRSVASVAGRLIEEAVELGLAAGLPASQIMERVIDSLAKQAAKASRAQGLQVLPSDLKSNISDLGGECGDVGLILKDVCHVAGIDLDAEENTKFDKLKNAKIKVDENGTISTIKHE
jgi:NTP pyrophosphatase (non-canonical NTP hydrolase)